MLPDTPLAEMLRFPDAVLFLLFLNCVILKQSNGERNFYSYEKARIF